MEAGPGLEDTTISEEAFTQVLNNLSDDFMEIQLSGGEIFSIEEILFDYIQIVQEKSKKRLSQNKGPLYLRLQTNGSWGGEQCGKTMKKLMLAGIEDITLASNDSYHIVPKEYFLNIQMNGMIADINVCVEGTHLKRDELMPLGRAESIVNENELFCDFGTHCKNSLTEKRLTIREDGNAYMCCFSQFKIGNIFDNPLDLIIESAMNHPVFSSVNSFGIGSALTQFFKNYKVKYRIEKHGPCGACYFAFIKSGIGNCFYQSISQSI
jgi:hypothetical protein